jgi:hypothetical protein
VQSASALRQHLRNIEKLFGIRVRRLLQARGRVDLRKRSTPRATLRQCFEHARRKSIFFLSIDNAQPRRFWMFRQIDRSIAIALLGLSATGAHAGLVVDDFEAGLPSGTASGVAVGFFTFAGGGGGASIATSTTPQPPGAAVGNHVMQYVGSAPDNGFAGFAHFFENPGANAWVTRDWTGYDTLSFWLYGNNTGTDLFVDIIDNRNPGSTTEDAERFVSEFKDDFSGWKQISLPFAGFVRKDIGNGAPDDGLGLNEVHGWAFGHLATRDAGSVTYYIDDVRVSAVPEPSTLLLTTAALAVLAGYSRRRHAR